AAGSGIGDGATLCATGHRRPNTANARMTRPIPVNRSAIPTTMLKIESISDMNPMSRAVARAVSVTQMLRALFEVGSALLCFAAAAAPALLQVVTTGPEGRAAGFAGALLRERRLRELARRPRGMPSTRRSFAIVVFETPSIRPIAWSLFPTDARRDTRARRSAT